ncbi:MAG TPA: trypsin-like peptidase domain-containing protein [Conexibacter sp.]|nr:trypsin-like peptidase domain-containing protein [Conexibacter sp.]
MHTPKALLSLTAAAVLGAAGGAVVVGVAGDAGTTATTTIETGAPQATRIADRPAGTLSAEQVYEHANRSVAFISAQVEQQSDSIFGGGEQGEATGTGFVVSEEGLIVTNAHVVEGATAIEVKVGDGAPHPATVVGRDASTDLALLRVDASGETLRPLQLADSGAVDVGDQVYAIGNPYGLDRTLTSGVVSALQRQIQAPNGYSIDGAVQTDAPINPGNSGGPLLDDRGRVIGVNSQILNGSGGAQGGNVGIGFAVPAATVRTVIAALEADGHVAHAWLGVSMGETGDGAGVQIADVVSGGPADEAGLQPGDELLALDGEPLDDSAALAAAINAHQPDDEVELTVRRDGAQDTVQATLGTQPREAQQP